MASNSQILLAANSILQSQHLETFTASSLFWKMSSAFVSSGYNLKRSYQSINIELLPVFASGLSTYCCLSRHLWVMSGSNYHTIWYDTTHEELKTGMSITGTAPANRQSRDGSGQGNDESIWATRNDSL